MKKRYNGCGSIVKVKDGKRKKRWRVRVSRGYDENGKRIVQNVGYFETRKEAEAALIEFLKNPYDVDRSKVTFKEMFELMYKQLTSNVATVSSRKYITSFNHVEKIHNVKMSELNYAMLVDALNYKTKDTQSKALTMIRYTFELAIKLQVPVIENYGKLITLKDLIQTKTAEKPRTVLEMSLIKNIESRYDNPLVVGLERIMIDMCMVFLYTGARPKELYELDIPDVNLEQNYVFLHSKNEAGHRRMPIHPRIRPIIEKYYAINKDKPFLFMNPRGKAGYKKTAFTDLYRELIHPTHLIYDFRHTFATYCHDSGLDRLTFQRMFGHTNEDVTDHYTKTLMSQLQREIKKLSYDEEIGSQVGNWWVTV